MLKEGKSEQQLKGAETKARAKLLEEKQLEKLEEPVPQESITQIAEKLEADRAKVTPILDSAREVFERADYNPFPHANCLCPGVQIKINDFQFVVSNGVYAKFPRRIEARNA